MSPADEYRRAPDLPEQTPATDSRGLERWTRVKALFLEALERPDPERSVFVAQVCAGDTSLAHEVESLLASEEAASTFLELPAAEWLGPDASEQPAATPRLQPGARLGVYEISDFIAAGGMGEVYRARHTVLGRQVALKIVGGPFSDDSARRLIGEAKHASILTHPSICTIYDAGEAGNIPFIVMAYVDGRPLSEILHEGVPEPTVAVEYGKQIADAVAHAHAHGIIHRDLKSSNVVIDETGRAIVLDFGIATRLPNAAAIESGQSTVRVHGVILGTLSHMAPEVLRGGEADARSDIWGLGTLLYELATGTLPFEGETSFEIASAILNEPPKPMSHRISLAMRFVIERCLVKDPDARYQRASDVWAALDSIGRRPSWPATGRVLVSGRRRSLVAAAGVAIAGSVGTWMLAQRLSSGERSANEHFAGVGANQWAQLTRLTDAVSQPSLSSDGRMLTFVRGPGAFLGGGEIYVKMLPDGEAVQLTHDRSRKMSPVFSPDNSKIAYTTGDGVGKWDTWIVPVNGGPPRLWLPNASGLVWLDKHRILFSEIKNGDIQMALVTAEESRAGARNVYVPVGDRDMAHRSYPSPNGKWVVAAEMSRGAWQPCRILPMDGSSLGHAVGPPAAPCMSAAWSPDGSWLYVSSAAGGAFHVWRQRFPDGLPEQVTAGPTQEEGITMAADGRSFVTAVGLRQSAMWVRDSRGERQVSIEGYACDPKFTPDGKRLLYRVVKGTLVISDPSELRVMDVETGRSESLLPGVAAVGREGRTYDISPDGQRVVVAVIDSAGKRRLWLTPIDRASAPHQIPNVEGEHPYFGVGGEIFFRAVEGAATYAYRVREDGTGLQKVIDRPIVGLVGVSRDGRWLLARFPSAAGTSLMGVPLRGGSLVRIAVGDVNESLLKWSADGRTMLLSVPAVPSGAAYIVPLMPGQMFPQIPRGGFQSEAGVAKLPGAVRIPAADAAPGPTPNVYAFSRPTVQRNLYRIPIP